MYFELKAFESGKTTKLQLDANPPFTNDPSPIIGPEDHGAAPTFDAKRTRELLLHVANELIPRIVAKQYSGKLTKEKNVLASLVKKYDGYKDPESTEVKEFLKEVIEFMNKSKDPILVNTTRFNYENLDTRFTHDVRLSVNGDIPPPPRPPKSKI